MFDRNLRLGFKCTGGRNTSPATHIMSNITIPPAVDWREKGVVTPTKNQGVDRAGPSVLSPLLRELISRLLADFLSKVSNADGDFNSYYCVTDSSEFLPGKLTSLSELVDCSKDWSPDTDLDNYGCLGGLMDNAFAYMMKTSHGDDTETAYPYRGVDGDCKFSETAIGSTIVGYKDVPTGTQFTCFTGTKVQILTHRTRLHRRREDAGGRGGHSGTSLCHHPHRAHTAVLFPRRVQ